MERILILLSIILLSGCAAGGPKFTESKFTKNPKKTEVFVFRLDKFVDGGSCYEIGINDNSIGALANGGFIRKEVAPGNHVIAVPMLNKTHLKVNFEGKENETLYFQFNVALNDTNAIPNSKILSQKDDYTNTQGELMHFDNLLAQVEEEYALSELMLLRDSSVKASCMATVDFKN
jgi:hypothetical protein